MGPDFSLIDSEQNAQQLCAQGSLVRMLLLPAEFSGPDIPENVVYVPGWLALRCFITSRMKVAAGPSPGSIWPSNGSSAMKALVSSGSRVGAAAAASLFSTMVGIITRHTGHTVLRHALDRGRR